MIKTLNKYNIKFIELDDGNEENINISINDYVHGNVNVLLLNSNLFGCGLNLQCTTDILFLHKTEIELEKQIIGRAQRIGRNNNLNIWYLMHNNENIIYTKKIKKEDYYNELNLLKFNENKELFSFENTIENSCNIAYYDSKFDNYMNIEE
jgi:hypothetical protein